MDIKNLLKNYHNKLAKEGVIKAIIMGLTIGFAVNIVFAPLSWLFNFFNIWLCLAVVFGVAAIASTLLYFFKFRPSDEDVARRVDTLGLQERIITMNELQNDTSYIAQRQREDAVAALNSVQASWLKVAVSANVIIAAAIAAFLSIGATTGFAVATSEGIWGDVILDGKEYNQEYEVSYEVATYYGDGVIEGDIFQIVKHGADTEAVLADPDDGFVFYGWFNYDSQNLPLDPESTDPFREDYNITKDTTFYAYFVANSTGEGEGDGEGDGGEGENDKPGDQGESGSQSNKPQNGPDLDSEGGPDQPLNDDNPDRDYGDENMIHNGETPYEGDFENSREEALGEMNDGDSDMPDSLKDIVNGYYEGINP